MTMLPAVVRSLSLIISVALVLNGLMVSPAHAQQRIIVVNADQPNIWTLEQAHYLLAQMHRRNLDLKAKSLEDLDPNEITGLRFDVMRMLIEFGATFNQAELTSNRLFSQNQQFNSTRRRDLTAEGDRLRKESLVLSEDIEDLQGQKADATTDAEKERLDAKITAKTNRLAKVDKEIENINGELKTLNVSAGELKGTEAGAEFDASKFPKSVFEEAFQDAAADQIKRFNEGPPKLNASLRLDNFLQMQYEIIAKQLTLLRDELGPGERLLFLEMPQTINVAHHEANDKWAQSWWKIAGYTRRVRRGEPEAGPVPTPAVRENQPPIRTSQDVNSILSGQPIPLAIDLSPALDQQRHCNPAPNVIRTDTNPIVISDGPGGVPATPLSFQVRMPGTVTSVTLQFRGLSHAHPDDLDMLLVGPQGQNAIIWSDAGGSNDVENLTITLDDAATSDLPNSGPLASGAYRPANYGGGDSFPVGAPTPLGGSPLSVFHGTNPNGEWKLYIVDDSGADLGNIAQGWSLNIKTAVPCEQVAYQNEFVELTDTAGAFEPNLHTYLNTNSSDLANRQVRTVELIPRQSSLNVSDMKLNVRSGAFNFVLSTLFGFGARLNVQRQREQFAQFVQQELYSSAFGKGSREFGWTFTPMPGMERLQSGVRTTYAVVVVPEEATSLVLETNGCYFPRSAYQPVSFANTKDPEWNRSNRTSRNCSGERSKAFVVPIPAATIGGSNDFWVNRISYQSVEKGKRIVVLISGENFSSQIGVLINGTPLPHSIGLAQPLIRDDSKAGQLTEQAFSNSEVQGRIERIDANKIVFSFTMPADFKGTPTITLVAPGKAIDLNWLTNIGINEKYPATLSEDSLNACPKSANAPPGCIPLGRPMFKGDPAPEAPPALRIDRVETFRQANNTLNVLIHGAGFAAGQRVFINGVQPPIVVVSETLITATLNPAPLDEEIQVSLNDGKDTVTSTAVVNPLQLKIDKVTVISYQEATNRRPGVLVVRIEGSGFTRGLQASPKKVQISVTSSREAFLTIPNPDQTEVVKLSDPVTKISITTLVARRPPE